MYGLCMTETIPEKKVCPKCKGNMWKWTSLLTGEVGYKCENWNNGYGCRHREVVKKGKINSKNQNLLGNLNKLMVKE